ncbi:unnamed protein product [Cuscuta epithymum]|uniref:COI1 F-box domain-containing protein n=1 Tax=Cuscuta epithymum TaxID=186058 RepID=A0AAV0CT49_9ASTE|nr:unnamed protein product [Cuscuta epithymum]
MSGCSPMSTDNELSHPSFPTSVLDEGGSGKPLICTTGSAGGGEGGDHRRLPSYFDQVPEDLLKNVLCFLSDCHDRNAASIVSKSWYRAEAMTRSEVFIGNGYAVPPQCTASRFGQLTSLILKLEPQYECLYFVPIDARFSPWVTVIAESYRTLQKLYLKNYIVSNEDMDILALSCPNLKELVLVRCKEVGTYGLGRVARDCSNLRVLEVIECHGKSDNVDWISCFPDDNTLIESLIFEDSIMFGCLNFDALEQLVTRSPCLKRLRLDDVVSISQLYRLMIKAPLLTHLGIGIFINSSEQEAAVGELELHYASAFAVCNSLVSLSGFRDELPIYLPALYPICGNLTSLNLKYTLISCEHFKEVIFHCHKLKCLWVSARVRDEGLEAVAATCKDLLELRVFLDEYAIDDDDDDDGDVPVSEVGLLAISEGCPRLEYLLYFCNRMSNAALVGLSKNCPDLLEFRLHTSGWRSRDYYTRGSMDEGFGAILMNCKKLTRLHTSGLLTDQALCYIGQYGKSLRALSFGVAGKNEMGLKFVLDGCPNLLKLEISDFRFGDSALRSLLHHFYRLQFVKISTRRVTHQCCEEIARQLPQLVIEVVAKMDIPSDQRGYDTLFMYRSLDEASTIWTKVCANLLKLYDVTGKNKIPLFA